MAAAAAAATVSRSGAFILSSYIRSNRSSRAIFAVGPAISASNFNKNCLVYSLFPRSSSSSRRFCSCSSPQLSTHTTEAAEAAAGAGENTENAPPEAAAPDPIKEAADALDIRVGHILKVWRHPEADSLYVEEVDVGEAEPRTICSGLVNYIPLDHLQKLKTHVIKNGNLEWNVDLTFSVKNSSIPMRRDAKVVVLANLKPRNMRGIKSNGMLMAASDASHETVELLIPPEGSIPGERIWFGSEEEKDQQPDPATPNQVQKKKTWECVQPHLKTTDACVAVLGERPMRTSAGLVACTTLKNANIS